MVEGIDRRGNVGKTCSCVMPSEPGLGDIKNVYCFGNNKISKRGVFSLTNLTIPFRIPLKSVLLLNNKFKYH